MTIPSSGPVSLQDLQTEFGGANPIDINEYYVGAATGYVVAGQYNTVLGNPPSSGAISLADFRGVTKITTFTFNDVVSANMTNYGLYQRAQAAGWNGTSELIANVTINSGVTVYGSNDFPAWAIWNAAAAPPTTLFPNGATITLTNNGVIAGQGGAGGTGGSANATSTTNGGAGGAGKVALAVTAPINVYNNGIIGGGGGGGGGGGAARATATDQFDSSVTKTWGHSGGGGGGGRTFGVAGNTGTVTGVNWSGPGNDGVAGTLASPGGGGQSFGQVTMISGGTIEGGDGGAGGELGVAGQPGASGTLTGIYDAGSVSLGGAGGAAGPAVTGGANVTWYAYGTRLGSIDNQGIDMVPGDVVDNISFSANNSFTGPNTNHFTFADIYFDGDGDVLRRVGDTTATAPITDIGNWYSPNSTGIGSSYWARITRTSGSSVGYSGDPLGTWIPLSSTLHIGHEIQTGGFQFISAEYLVQISTTNSNSNIVEEVTVFINLTTEV